MSEHDHVDLDYRPTAYFGPQRLEAWVLSRVKGAALKAQLRALLASEQHEAVAKLLRKHGVPREASQALEKIDPQFMGGNYLPDMGGREVEIARIRIASTTADVTSVYARPRGRRIQYRVVDEYEGTTLWGPGKRQSVRPLTLIALYEFLTDTWPFYQVLSMNYGRDVEAMLGFFGAESEFYPQLDAFCRAQVVEHFSPRDETDDEVQTSHPDGPETTPSTNRGPSRDQENLSRFVHEINSPGGASPEAMSWWLNRY
jgi:hypothetical protein